MEYALMFIAAVMAIPLVGAVAFEVREGRRGSAFVTHS